MPDLGFYHPIVIHFAIGLLAVGVLFRRLSLISLMGGGTAVAVRAHQKWGERTRNLAVAIGGLELLALALRGRAHTRRLLFASAGLGVVAVLSVLQTGKLGGELVYAHAGGVGIRSGDPEDVARLLLAGLVAQADLDEKADRAGDAATLLEIAAQRFPADPTVQVRAAEALLED